jgi:hypothetical protein
VQQSACSETYAQDFLHFSNNPPNSQLEETVAAKSFPAFFQQPCKCPSDFGQFVQKIWVLEEPAAQTLSCNCM